MQILKRTGIDWRKRRLISKLYMDQRVKMWLDRGETRSVQFGRGVRQGCGLSRILFNLYSECLTKEALDGLGFPVSPILRKGSVAWLLIIMVNRPRTKRSGFDSRLQQETFSSPKRPDVIRDRPSRLFSRPGDSFSRGTAYRAWSWKTERSYASVHGMHRDSFAHTCNSNWMIK